VFTDFKIKYDAWGRCSPRRDLRSEASDSEKSKLFQLGIKQFSRCKSWLAIKESGDPMMRQATAATKMSKWFQIPCVALDRQVVDCFKSNRQQECEAQLNSTVSISLVVHTEISMLLQLGIEQFSRCRSWLAIKESGNPIMRQAAIAGHKYIRERAVSAILAWY
jgi:hypothetical protein